MKNFIAIVVLCLFCLLSIHPPNAFSQESCPKTLEEVQKNKRYKILFIGGAIYDFKQGEYSLLCSYGKNGKLEDEVPHIAGKRTGVSRRYYESGSLMLETPYVAGKKEGISKLYYENGKLRLEMPYVADKVEGVGKEYYESGKLLAEIPYVVDKIDGICKNYYESGKLQYEIPYIAGQREGNMTYYEENGKMAISIKYTRNLAVSGIYYKTNGTTRALTDQELADFMRGKMSK